MWQQNTHFRDAVIKGVINMRQDFSELKGLLRKYFQKRKHYQNTLKCAKTFISALIKI